MAGESPGAAMRSMLAAIHAAPLTLKHRLEEDARRPRPFITISRQGGAGGRTIGTAMMARLNELDPGEEPWSLWDRELVEKVVNDHHLTREMVESLESTSRPWMQEFLSALSLQPDVTDVRIYRSVAMTIRALAQHGRVIIVGRGGVFITRKLPGGIHLRLTAPLDYRIAHMARQLGLSREAAVAHVRQLDHLREAFYKRYWPKEVRGPESFTLTFNMAAVDEHQVVESVLPLVLPHAHVTVATHGSQAIVA